MEFSKSKLFQVQVQLPQKDFPPRPRNKAAAYLMEKSGEVELTLSRS